MLPKIKTKVPGPKSLLLATKLAEVESPNITYRDSKFPIFWKRGFESNIEDVDGNIYIDLTAAFGVAALGHANRGVIDSMISQLESLPHGMGDVHPPEIKVRLLELLASLFPESGAQTILCSSGAESVEAALKTAQLKTQKPGVLYFDGAYHGLTYGTLAISGNDFFRTPFQKQIAPLGWKFHFPNSETEASVSISQIDEMIMQSELTRNPIGALIVEPIQGRAGIRIPPKKWLFNVAALCKKHNVVFILDEIFTGFGRTASLFAFQQEDVTPDLLCIGKALTGTLPFSACIGKKEVMSAWPKSEGEALHTSTFLGNPLGCQAALTSIQEIIRLQLPARSKDLGEKALNEISSWKELPLISEVRGRGLMLGIELKLQNKTQLAVQIAKKALEEGVIVLPSGKNGNVISISPPLNIPEELLFYGLSVIKKSISSFDS